MSRGTTNWGSNTRETMRGLYELTEKDIYDIKPLESMNDLLVPETSLCIVHNPCWSKEVCWMYDYWNKFHIRGFSNSGAKARVEIYKGHIHDLGRYKGRLDEVLLSAYLFVSWRKHFGHTFRMFQKHEIIAEFPNLESALAAYLPDGFTPQKLYRLAHTPSELWRRSLRRCDTMLYLLRLLYRRVEQLSAEVCSEFYEQDALKKQ